MPMVCNVYLTQIIRGCGEEENQLKHLKTNSVQWFAQNHVIEILLPVCSDEKRFNINSNM